MVSMDTCTPKRSHSLAHHKEYTRKKGIESQQVLLTQQPTTSVSTTLPKSGPVIHPYPVRLVRSSSLSHQSQKLPTRSNSLPPQQQQQLKPITTTTTIIENPTSSPISTSTTTPFRFLQQPPPLPKHLIPPRRTSSLNKKPTTMNNKNIMANEEVTKALLEWKHKAGFKVDWNTMFSPSVELWNENNIFGSVEDLLSKDKVLDASRSLWIENESFVPKKEIASYLGKLDPFHHNVLQCYLDFFNFNEMNLADAFRKLCSKLYFKAEAQEIDRILEAFSIKYWNTNKSKAKLYQTADVVYTITYSIMLLNTDLHLVQISSHAKMSCALFIENTMSTVLEQKNISFDDDQAFIWKIQLEENLKDIYTSVRSHGVLQPISDDEPKSFLKRMGSLTQRKKRTISITSSHSH
ncbi:Sec7 domain-containing protein [Pilaira anomala]|nr:Sec7 domain-containing protein [Pilaira anomala]